MIVRDEGATWLLITQPDHAALAGHIAAHVRSEPALDGPHRDSILLATREHDNGWAEWDAKPTIDPDTGRVTDFIHGPSWIKHDLWPRGIARVASLDPRAGALIAQHVLTVYDYRRAEREWAAFFEVITSMRDRLLAGINALHGDERAHFEREYRTVRLGDIISLQFCNAWSEEQEAFGYRSRFADGTVVIQPDPFAGQSVALSIAARRIPATRYENDQALRRAVAAAETVRLTARAVGGA